MICLSLKEFRLRLFGELRLELTRGQHWWSFTYQFACTHVHVCDEHVDDVSPHTHTHTHIYTSTAFFSYTYVRFMWGSLWLAPVILISAVCLHDSTYRYLTVILIYYPFLQLERTPCLNAPIPSSIWSTSVSKFLVGTKFSDFQNSWFGRYWFQWFYNLKFWHLPGFIWISYCFH